MADSAIFKEEPLPREMGSFSRHPRFDVKYVRPGFLMAGEPLSGAVAIDILRD